MEASCEAGRRVETAKKACAGVLAPSIHNAFTLLGKISHTRPHSTVQRQLGQANDALHRPVLPATIGA